MLKRLRKWGAIPVFPAILTIGAILLQLPAVKLLLLGLLAVGGTALCWILLTPKAEPSVPTDWRSNLKKLRRTVEKIKNKTVYRGGQEILTELKQCETSLPYLTAAARREITEYYLPTFARYFTAYSTFEECNEGNPSVLATMAQMERSMGEIAENFRHTCDRNDRTATLHVHADAALLRKKLQHAEEPDHG